MPLYEFECSQCHHRFERLQRLSDAPPSACPECGGPVSQLMSAPAIQFKGSGWYVTDYAKKSSAAAPPSSSAKAKSGADSSTTEKSSTEKKPESKKESSNSADKK